MACKGGKNMRPLIDLLMEDPAFSHVAAGVLYKRYIALMVQYADLHPIQRQMTIEGTMEREFKRNHIKYLGVSNVS